MIIVPIQVTAAASAVGKAFALIPGPGVIVAAICSSGGSSQDFQFSISTDEPSGSGSIPFSDSACLVIGRCMLKVMKGQYITHCNVVGGQRIWASVIEIEGINSCSFTALLMLLPGAI
jgi:hypothetical protein